MINALGKLTAEPAALVEHWKLAKEARGYLAQLNGSSEQSDCLYAEYVDKIEKLAATK